MASTASHLLHVTPLPQVRNTHTSKPPNAATFPTRRRSLLLLLPAALIASEAPARAQDIGLFGIRKKIEKAEKKAEEVVKEGVEATEKGLVAAEKGLEAAEKGLETVEKEVEEAVAFGGFAQAGAVAGAEVVGVLVATSIVNGILGPEAQNS